MPTSPSNAHDDAPSNGAGDGVGDATGTCPPVDVLEEYIGAPPNDATLDDLVAAHLARCERCTRLVESLRADHEFLLDVGRADRNRIDAIHDAAPRVKSIPGYELGDEIARGGQGVVVRGVQRSTGRAVAVKLLTAGRLATSRQRRRFEHEIEAVSALRHPGIVTLYDGGIADETADGGVPWFAMEFVHGARLDDWTLENRHDRDALVEAFTRIVEAVAAAHRSGVIHRDLKPGNMLVDRDGQPRILDFGLAVAQTGRSEGAAPIERGFVGTLAYAAPEQFDGSIGPVDACTDVYALGIILHEMLTGRRPFEDEGPIEDAIRRRFAAPPTNTDLRASGVDGDLTAIVRRAAAPEPERRYASASALLDDLQRRRTKHPVAARGDGALYLLSRFALRHRVAVASLVVIVLLLVLSTVVASTLLVQRDAQRQRAERSLTVLTESLLAADPLAGPGGPTAIQFIDAVGEQIDGRFGADRAASEAIHRVLGGVALNLGDLDRAGHHFERVLKTQLAADRHDPLAIAAAQHDVARVRFFMGDLESAGELYRDSLETRRRLLGEHHSDVATSLSHLASCLRRLGELDEAELLLRGVLAIRRATGEPHAIAAAINNLGSLQREKGATEAALNAYGESIELLRESVEADDWRLAHVLVNLASVQIDLGYLESATRTLDDANAILKRRVDSSHPKRQVAAIEHVRLLLATGRLDDAHEAISAIAAPIEGAASVHAEVAEAMRRLHAHAKRVKHDAVVERAAELLGIPTTDHPSNGH